MRRRSRPTPTRRALLALAVSSVLAAATGGCGSATRASSPATSSAAGPATTAAGPLEAPAVGYGAETLYFQDLAKVDQDLSSYVSAQQGVALKALLTDGSAFCAFLKRGGGVDDALEATAIGANSVEAQTHLPQNVKTFNSIEAVALVTLCPSEQSLLPPDDQARIATLAKDLSTATNEPLPTIPSSLPADGGSAGTTP